MSEAGVTWAREKERKDESKKEGEGGPGSVQLCEHIKQSRLCQGFSTEQLAWLRCSADAKITPPPVTSLVRFNTSAWRPGRQEDRDCPEGTIGRSDESSKPVADGRARVK